MAGYEKRAGQRIDLGEIEPASVSFFTSVRIILDLYTIGSRFDERCLDFVPDIRVELFLGLRSDLKRKSNSKRGRNKVQLTIGEMNLCVFA